MNDDTAPGDKGFECVLRTAYLYDQDSDSEWGLPPVADQDHPLIHAAHAAILDSEPLGQHTDLTLNRIRSAEQITKAPIIGGVRLSEEAAEITHYVVTELIRNIEEHSGSKAGGFVRVSLLGDPPRIGIGVADRGIGLRSSLSRFHVVRDDPAAVMFALKAGVSGSTRKIGGNKRNAGAGLFFIRGIAALSGTGFLLASGTAAWSVQAADTPASDVVGGEIIASTLGNWQGTLAGVDIPLNLPHSRGEIFRRLNKAYAAQVKDLREDMYQRRSLLGTDPNNAADPKDLP